jgi:two-component sensor histidine kinase
VEQFDKYSLKELGLLEKFAAETFDHLTDLAANILGAPVSLVSIIDHQNDRQYFSSIHGQLTEPYHSQRSTPLTHSFCKHVASSNQPLIVVDANKDERTVGNGAIQDLGVIAYLGVPVHNPQNEAIGALCAIGAEPRQWSETELEHLKALAVCVDNAIKFKSTRLTAEKERASQLASKLVAGELNHRLNNLFAAIQSLVELTKSRYDDVPSYAADLSNRVYALSHANKASIRSGSIESFYIDELVQDVLSQYQTAGYSFKLHGTEAKLAARTAIPLGLIINELATNAIKHGAWSLFGDVTIRIEKSGADFINLSWEEDAPGGVSQPTSSTSGFGTNLIAMSLSQLGTEGTTEWRSQGLKFGFNIPVLSEK